MSKWSNVIRGVAYGDSWGDKNEFKMYNQLIEGWDEGPDLPEKLRITDDTQMTLSLARALHRRPPMSNRMIRARVMDEFVLWYLDKDNNRAPGRTCMSACAKLARDADWMDATVIKSDGCGTVMRTSACAFLPDRLWAPVAAWQAVVTHGGTNSVAAALVATATIRAALEGKIKPGDLTAFAFAVASQPHLHIDRFEEVGRWLAWHEPIFSDNWNDQKKWLMEGFKAQAKAIGHALSAVGAFQADPWANDPCDYGGQGWRAHECLATALLSADTFPDDRVAALRRATVTNGDSDSIAAVAGALLGAVHDEPWPEEWFERLEPRYQDWITESDGYVFA